MSESIINRRITLDDIIMQTVEELVNRIGITRTESGTNGGISMTMTVDELAETLGIAKPKAYELTNTDGFPSFKVGKRILINRKGLQDWIEKQCNDQIKGRDYFV